MFACSSASPTAPTPPPPVALTPPAVTTPPVVTPITPAPNPLLSDPRFDLTFYRQLATNSYDQPRVGLRRLTQPPRIYLRTVHDLSGASIDALTLNATADAAIGIVGPLTGVFGVAGLERGTASHDGEPGWITIHFTDDPTRQYCGSSRFDSGTMELYVNSPCRCVGGPAVRLRTVKHELGHLLGFWHTDNPSDLMYGGGQGCDANPSARETFHAQLAYTQALGSLDPK